MLFAFFNKLRKFGWLPWLGMTPFLLFPLILMTDGELSKGMGILLFFGSAFSGVVIGDNMGRLINTRCFERPEEFQKSVSSGLSAFCFLALPTLVGRWTNSHLDTEIGLSSLPLAVQLLWATMAGVFFFFYTNS